MQDLVTRYLKKFKKEHRMRRRLGGVLLVLALMVSIGVYWQLKLTGAALTNETYCGKEEHTHDSEECYEWVLVCGYDDVTESEVTVEELEALWEAGLIGTEDADSSAEAVSTAAEVSDGSASTGHTHTAECYETVTTLVCEQEESETVTVTTEGHTHDDACYTVVLSCGQEEGEGHTHNESCYETEMVLTCGLEESEGHTHSEDCYDEEGNLICGLEESEGHIHDESCYTEVETLVCGLEESEGHTHDDSCYTTELICGQEEAETVTETIEGHTHDESCYVTEQVLVCGLEDTEGEPETTDHADDAATTEDENNSENTGDTSDDVAENSDEASEEGTSDEDITNAETTHVHSAACYQKVLVCELEEHTHTAACLSDNTADVETAEDWEATLPSDLSEDWAEAVVEIAKSQLGYTESIANFTLDENGETQRGYTRYGAWAGNVYGDWDAMFASFCLSYAGLSTEDFPESTGASAWAVKLKELDLFADAADYVPTAGDLVFLDSDEDGKIDRVGIVISADEESDKLTVIEGDYAVETDATESGTVDAVCEVEYSLSAACVLGYGVLPEYVSEFETFTATADGVIVTVTAPTGALPDGAELVVSLIEEGSDAYNAAAEAIGYEEETVEVSSTESEDGIALASEEDAETETETVATSGLAVLDISFMVDGVEVEPTEAVTVSIDASAIIPEEADASTIEVQHLTETEEGVVESTVVANATEETAGTVTVSVEEETETTVAVAEFEVESFSMFTITWSSNGRPDDNKATTSIIATTYLYGTNTTIGSDSISLTGTSGMAFDLTSSNSDLAIDGYTLVSASVTYNGKAYDNVTAVTVTVTQTEDRDTHQKTTTYTYAYTDSEGSYQLYSDSSSQTVTISLYYVENAGITISATGDDTNGYTMSATTAGSYTYSDKSWSIDDTSVATLTTNSDGTVTVKWTDDAESGDTVTVTVTSAYTDYLGATQTVTDTYTLTNGQIEVTIMVYWGTNGTTTRSGATVSLYDSDGNFVTSGTTNSNGQVTFTVTPGTYNVVASYTSGNTSYGNGTGNEITFSTTSATASVYIDSSNSYGMANHVDLEVTGSLTLTINGQELTFTTYVYDGSISVTTPDGTNIGSDGTLQSSNVTGYSYEYRISASVSKQWDSDDGVKLFSLDGYVLISQSAVQTYINNGTITAAQAEAIFGEVAYYNAVTYGETTVVPAGYYYKITFSDYHPEENVCGSSEGGRGYDFVLDIDKALSYLEDMLTVSKYVVNESGAVLDDTMEFTFTLAGADSNTSSYSSTTQLSSGESDTFEDLTAGYYMVTEASSTGYIPVTVTANSDGTYTVAESGYVQYVQSDIEKEEGKIASVTFYNLKLSTLGVVKLQKAVDGDASSSYSDNTFTFMLYSGNDASGYTQVSNLGNITVSAGGSTEFYLAAGTYTIVELGSTLTSGDSQTVTIGDSTLTRTVAGASDPYGLTEGTVYYVGTITVTAGESLTYTATNTYTSSTNVTIKKVDESGNALSNATFTLVNGSNEYYSVTNEVGSWSAVEEGGTVPTVTLGELTVALSDGSYTLTETDAPDGYNLLTGPITIEVDDSVVSVSYAGNTDTETYVSYDAGTMTITVKNKAGYELPSTGGTGTLPYTLLGLLLCGGAALLYCSRRRLV